VSIIFPTSVELQDSTGKQAAPEELRPTQPEDAASLPKVNLPKLYWSWHFSV